MKTIIALAALLASPALPAVAADYGEPPPPPPAYVYPAPPVPAHGSPGVVFYAPVYVPPSRCLPGFFWRVYPDGNGECWPWEN